MRTEIKYGLTAFLLVWAVAFGRAQHERGARFDLVEGDNLVVEAEFPLSLWESVQQADPSISDAHDSTALRFGFEGYFKKKFRAVSTSGKTLLPKRISRRSKAESDPISYRIEFEAGTVSTIRNNLMCERPEHTNHHVVHLNGAEVSFTTSRAEPDFVIRPLEKKGINPWLWLLALPPVALLLLKRFLGKASRRPST